MYTTRDVRIGLRSEAIHFSARDADVSLHILLGSAEMCERAVERFIDTVRGVLTLCYGIPMTLLAVRLGLHWCRLAG